MLLRRQGKKNKISKIIQEHFPKHSVYIEPFFGAGGLFFDKPKAPYNLLNDYDEDVYNLFMIVKDKKDELYDRIKNTPQHEKIWKDYKYGKPDTDIERAVRFLYISNFSLYGAGNTYRFALRDNGRQIMLEQLEAAHKFLQDTNILFSCCDAATLIDKLTIRNGIETDITFVYCDPPYLGTKNNYSNGYTYNKLCELIETMLKRNLLFAISEFDTVVTDKIQKDYDLNKYFIKERITIKNRNTEIILTNYDAGVQCLLIG